MSLSENGANRSPGLPVRTERGEAPAVGYQGAPGAHSEEALRSFLSPVHPVPHRTLNDLFQALSDGEVEFALVPIENSHAGTIGEVYDLLLEHEVSVIAEHIHEVHLYLLGVEGTEPSQVEVVYSHPQALAQTDRFLRNARLQSEPYYDTAGAAQMVAERGDRRYAAVASRLAGDHYGLAVLAEGIETSPENATRFFLVKRGAWLREQTVAADGPGRTSVVFGVPHQPGALVRALTCFARERINLSRLESRPSKNRPWEYLFFTDIDGYVFQPE